jgi:Ni/Fe-hydrogenase subunit HybB-like protein
MTMDLFMKPAPVPRKFLTPGVIVLILLALNGLAFLAGRLFFGIGAVTNLSNQYPWGIWIGIDVAGGVALAAGGFTTAALGHVMNRDEYHAVVRPALLTAMLGYTFVALGVMIDIGRWYYIWHPLVFWNGSSALFEVGICVTIYLNVLYIEFLPIVTERFIGRVALPGLLARFDALVEKLLRALDRGWRRPCSCSSSPASCCRRCTSRPWARSWSSPARRCTRCGRPPSSRCSSSSPRSRWASPW